MKDLKVVTNKKTEIKNNFILIYSLQCTDDVKIFNGEYEIMYVLCFDKIGLQEEYNRFILRRPTGIFDL